jgi:holo-[acyl-carrier protein] synthase
MRTDRATREQVRAVGLDVQAVEEVAEAISSFGADYLSRVHSDAELAEAGPRAGASEFAARFAAKEAVVKAIGIPDAAALDWRCIEILRGPAGFRARLSGTALEAASAASISTVCLALSSSPAHGCAVALAL